MTISCIAVEDEPPALEKLVSFIDQTPWLELKGRFSGGLEALSFLRNNQVQLIFLDIHMDGLNGLQLLDSLPYKPDVILTTAFSQYAIKGYEYNVTDYLLKPYSFERFLQAVQKVQRTDIEKTYNQSTTFIFVKSDYRIVKIEMEDIFYIEGMRDYRCIVSKQGKILTPTTFTELENMLPRNLFPRIHKSYMVSLRKINSIEHQRVFIADNVLPIGDSYKVSFYEKLKLFQ